jgi:hypothetical protein
MYPFRQLFTVNGEGTSQQRYVTTNKRFVKHTQDKSAQKGSTEQK